jgi:hypothetical protein
MASEYPRLKARVLMLRFPLRFKNRSLHRGFDESAATAIALSSNRLNVK